MAVARRPHSRKTTGRAAWLLAPGLVLACALLGSAVGVRSGEPRPTMSTVGRIVVPAPKPPDLAAQAKTIVFPPDKAVILRGTLDVIARTDAASLAVNGKPQEWEPFRPPLRAAQLHVSAGMNTIQVGDRRSDLFFARYPGDEDAPKDWPVLRWHQIEVKDGRQRCGACHKADEAGGLVDVGETLDFKACLKCHNEERFAKIHAHPLEPLQTCRMCHTMHGATRNKLLKAPRQQLCAECHEP